MPVSQFASALNSIFAPKYGGEPPESEPCAKIVPMVSSALILTSGLHKARVAGSSLPPVLFIFISPEKVAF